MKSKWLSSFCGKLACRGLLLGFAFLSACAARAANPVLNPGFESLFVLAGVTNWSVVYVVGCPADFAVKGRTTASMNGNSGVGANMKPMHDGLMHAYFKQVVSGLTPGAAYAVTNWMLKPGHGGEAWVPKVHVYSETIGGLGSVTAEYFPDQNIINQNGYQIYQRFVLTNTADSNGQIEIRLHFNKDGFTTDNKWFYIHGWYDDVSLGLVSPPITYPPYKILSFSLTNQTATFKWETVSNQLYRILVSPNLSTWTTFQDNLLATGTNLTFTTNVSVNNPQYFRIFRP